MNFEKELLTIIENERTDDDVFEILECIGYGIYDYSAVSTEDLIKIIDYRRRTDDLMGAKHAIAELARRVNLKVDD